MFAVEDGDVTWIFMVYPSHSNKGNLNLLLYCIKYKPPRMTLANLKLFCSFKLRQLLRTLHQAIINLSEAKY